MKPAILGNSRIPVHGTIVGGPLDGWSYAWLRFHIWPSGQADPVVRAAMPGWPFPQDVVLTYRSYGRLESIRGVRTARVSEHAELIKAVQALNAKKGSQ